MLWLSIVIVVILEALWSKWNTSGKLMIRRYCRDARYPFDSARYFPSVCKNPKCSDSRSPVSLSAVFDESDENLTACSGVCYVFNGAHRPTDSDRVISDFQGHAMGISSTCRSWIFMNRETCTTSRNVSLSRCCSHSIVIASLRLNESCL